MKELASETGTLAKRCRFCLIFIFRKDQIKGSIVCRASSLQGSRASMCCTAVTYGEQLTLIVEGSSNRSALIYRMHNGC